jgi:hypothetical protein
MPIWGFIAGFVAGASGISALFGDSFLATALGWVVGAVLGLIFALLVYFFYWAAVIILGASVGYSIGAGIITGIGLPGILAFVVGLSFATAAVLLTIFLDVPQLLIIIFTALGGAGALIAGILLWIGRIKVEDLNQGAVAAAIKGSWFWFMVYIVVAAAGVFTQIASSADVRLERTAYQY